MCAAPLELLNAEFLLLGLNNWSTMASIINTHAVLIAAFRAENSRIAAKLMVFNAGLFLAHQNGWNRLASAIDAHEVIVAALKARDGMASQLVVFNTSVSLNLWLLRSLASTKKSVQVRWWKHVALMLIAAAI